MLDTDYQDYLSEDLEEDTIGNMLVGDIGYTTPWAVSVDKNRKLWIDRSFTITNQPEGTSHLKVKRIDDRYIIDRRSIGKFKYSISDQVGREDKNYSPVSLTYWI